VDAVTETETPEPQPTADAIADSAPAETTETATRPAAEPAPPRARKPAGFGLMAVLGPTDLVVDWIIAAVTLGILSMLTSVLGFAASSVFTYTIPWITPAWIPAIVLVGLVPWVLRVYGEIERRRAAAVYGIEITALPRRRTEKSGFGGFIHQWWLDASDSTPWRALAKLVVTIVLVATFGVVALLGIGGGIAAILAGAVRTRPDVEFFLSLPDWAFPIIGSFMILLGVAAAIGYGYIDRIVSREILGVSETALMRRQVETLSRQRAGAVNAAADQRRRIERDLHDDVQPRLVSIAMTLGMAKGRLDTAPEEARELIDQAHAEAKDALTELRRLVQGFQPAVLADRGLDAALSAVVARCPVPTTLTTSLGDVRCSSESEAVIYFAVTEALTNVAKHARATRCSVSVARVGERLVATITDDGVGGAHIGATNGHITAGGLSGMLDRTVAAGGHLTLSSPIGGPTTITVEVPCAS